MKGAQLPHAALFLQSVLFCFALLDCNKKIHLYPDYRTKHTPLLFFFNYTEDGSWPTTNIMSSFCLCLKPQTVLPQPESKAVACRTGKRLCLKAYLTQGHFQEALKHPASTYKWPDYHSYFYFYFYCFCLVTVDVSTGGLTRLEWYLTQLCCSSRLLQASLRTKTRVWKSPRSGNI